MLIEKGFKSVRPEQAIRKTPIRPAVKPNRFGAFGCVATTRTYQPAAKPLVKICGVTTPGDAELAAKAGADFVGSILWPKARRAVSASTAKKIADAARKYGAEPVGVFVDEDFATIVRSCKTAGLRTAQLHGKGARAALPDLPDWLQVRNPAHQLLARVLRAADTPLVTGKANWLLIDGLKAGSGEAYDWHRLRPPEVGPGTQGWLLAGGLTPSNVAEAVALANPTGVDVSSGVTAPGGLLKDPEKVFQFIEEVRRSALQLEQAEK